MNNTDITTEKPDTRSLFPELDDGVYQLAAYLHQYVQSIRQIEKRPAPANAAR